MRLRVSTYSTLGTNSRLGAYSNKYGSIKTQWKGWVNFFKFQSMSILPIRCNRRQKTVSVAKYGLKKQNWNIIFEIKLMRTHSV